MTLPDRRYRWLIVAYTLVIQAVSVGTLMYCFALFVVPWLAEFDQPRSTVMFAVTALQMATGAISPFAGRFMDRYPPKWLILAGVATMAAGLGLISLASAFWQIMLVYGVLFALTMALTGTLAAQTLVAKWFDDRRGLAIGISATGTSLGGMLLPLLVAVLISELDWRLAAQILAVGAVVLVVPLTLIVLARELPTPRRAAPASARAAAPVPAAPVTTLSIVGSPMFWIPTLGLIPMNAAFGAVQFNLGAFSADLGYGASVVGGLIALNSFCMVVGKLFFGAVGDRLDHRYLLWLSMALMVGALVLLQNQPSFAVLVTAMVLVGLSAGGMLPMMGVLYSARFGVASFGRVMGLVMMFITLGGFGPPLAGAIFDATGSYDVAFGAFIVALVVTAVPVAWLPPPARLV